MTQVSVIMAAYNVESYIEQAISSLLGQTLTNFELFVVDDASTDATVAKVEAIQDSRIHLIKLENNAGVSAVRNHALLMCNSPYVAIMDADDISEPSRLKKQVQFMDLHPEVVAVGSWTYLIAPKGKRIYLDKSPPTTTKQIMDDLFESGGGIFPNTTVMRTDIVHKIGGYREVFPSSEDLDLLLRMTQFGVLANLPEALYCYRLNPNGITFSSKARRDHYAKQALELWRERKSKGRDKLDDGETLTDLPVTENSVNLPEYGLNQVISYFYRQNAKEKIKKGDIWQGFTRIIHALFYQPLERKNWVALIKVVLGKAI